MATVPDEARLDDQRPPDGGLDGEPGRHRHRRLPGLRWRRGATGSDPLTGDPSGTTTTSDERDDTRPTGDAEPDDRIDAPGAAPATAPTAPTALTARRERRRRRATRRRWAVTVPAVLAVLVVIAVVGAQLRGDAPARARATSSGAAAPLATNVPTLLLTHLAANGRIDLAALVGISRDGRDGSILLVPTLTQAETPSLDFQVLADLRALGSTALLQTTVENLLGVRIDGTQVFDDARLTAALAAAGPITVDLNGDTEVGQGDRTRVFPAGTQRITAADAVALLTQRPAADEIDHMVTVQAVFEGWLAALRTPQGTAATNARVPVLSTLVAAAHTATDFSVVPVDAISSGPGERYQAREDALGSAMREAFPSQQLAVDGRRLRTEILNGTGVVGLVQQVARVVVPAGAEVVTTGNMPGFGQATTRVVYYRDADRDAAARLLAVLGRGKLVKEPNDIQVFDVTIIAGADFSTSARS